MNDMMALVEKIEAIVQNGARNKCGLLLLAAAVALLLGACGGGQSAAAVDPDALPGTEEFGMTKAELVQNIEAVEANIAQCMSDAGFEYVAADYDTVRAGMVADKSLPGMSEEAFVEQYGYGISTLYTGLPPQLAGETVPAKLGLGRRNIDIFNALSPADQVAYNRTLFGENSATTFAVAIEAEDFSGTGGCTRSAIEQVFSAEQLSVSYKNPLDAMIEQDPRMVEAFEKYTECVRDEGFDYSHPEQIETDFKNRVAALTGGEPLESLTAAEQEALRQLQGEERAVAIVAFQCEEDILSPVEERIQRELFAQIVK